MIKNKKELLTTICATLCLLVVCFLCWRLFEQMVLISIDDAMYGGWTQHGLKFFIEKNIWHYKEFNGRFLVHLIMQIVLFFEEHLYAILFPFFIGISTFIITSIAKPEWKISTKIFTTSMPILLFLGLESNYLTATLWAAGGFNYIFPLMIVSIFYLLFLKYRKNNKAMLWLIPLSIVSGATTEQYGMYTIGLITMTYCFEWIDNKKLDKRCFIYLIAPITGLLTILLAPPTLNRVSEATGANLTFMEKLFENYAYIGIKETTKLMPIAFMMSIGIMTLCKQQVGDKKKFKYHPILISGIVFAIISFIFYGIENYYVPAILSLIFLVMTIVVMCLKKETRILGMILICGFGTFFMMIFTSTASIRTCIPCVISCIIVLSIMLIDTITSANKKMLSIGILLILAIIAYGRYTTYYSGYVEQAKWQQDLYNQYTNAKETGYIKYNWEDSLNASVYRSDTLIDHYPLSYYQAKFEIPDDVEYIISSSQYDVANVAYNGFYSQLPAIRYNEKVYIPSETPFLQITKDRFVYTTLIMENDEILAIEVDGKTAECTNEDLLIIKNFIFVEINTLSIGFDMDFTYDEKSNSYLFCTK